MGDHHIIPEPPAWPRADAGILAEVPSALGLVLWQAVRHARDWLAAAPGARAALFHPTLPAWVVAKRAEARALAPELPALDRVLGLTRAPLGVEPGVLAEACREVALWGEQRGYREVAIHYAEAAARAAPADPRLANLAGRLTRNAGEYARAELWLERGIGLARRRRDRVEYTRGHLGMGLLWQLLGDVSGAKKHFSAAAVAALKSGREWLAAEARHDLFTLLVERGSLAEAALQARQALACYPKNHPRLPFFAADVAFLLIREQQHTEAIRLLECTIDKLDAPSDRALGMSLLARALAGARRLSDFEIARRHVDELLGTDPDRAPAARIHLAEGERSLGMWEAAEGSARAALAAAEARGAHQAARLSEALLASIMNRAPATTAAKSATSGLIGLATTVTERLSLWAPTRKGRLRSIPRREWAA